MLYGEVTKSCVRAFVLSLSALVILCGRCGVQAVRPQHDSSSKKTAVTYHDQAFLKSHVPHVQ